MPEASRRIIQLSPEDASLPEGLLLPPGDGGEVVVFLVDPQVRTWAGPALVRLARGWSERGRHALLVEGDFTAPFLEETLNVQGREGVSDALLYGASPERVRMPVEGDAFQFSPAGTVVPDPVAVWRHPGWGAFLASVRAEGMVTLLALPADREVALELTALADRVFHMQGTLPGSDAPWPVIHPPGAAPQTAGRAPGGPGGSPSGLEGGGAEEARGTGPEPATAAARPAGTGDAAAPASSVGPSGERASAKGGGSRGRVLLLVLVLVFLALALLGAAWFGFIEIPGLALPGA